jgi:hypothetical protein
MGSKLKRELVVLAVLLAVGLFGLPPAIYWVGQHVIGRYGDGGGLWDLTEAVWLALLQGHVGAWLLVLSPYVVVQLLRATRLIWRSRRPVSP